MGRHWSIKSRLKAAQRKASRRDTGSAFLINERRDRNLAAARIGKSLKGNNTAFYLSPSGTLMQIPAGQKMPQNWTSLSKSQVLMLARRIGFKRRLGQDNSALVLRINNELKKNGIKRVLEGE